jgi:hypothetical protein
MLAGDTATYAEVLPGVDLRLTAGVEGFDEVLVVKTRAAADPELGRLRFASRAAGLKARAGKDGAIELVDAGGRMVFASSAPRMWDSSAPARHAVGRFELAADAVTVVPDRHLLTDPATVFPVSIDPDYWVPSAGWTKVFSGTGSGTGHWMGAQDDGWAKVGQCYRPEPAILPMRTPISHWQTEVT